MTTVIETKTNEHTIPSRLLEKTVRITVVGCGGTGSAVASGLPYLHQAMLALGHPGGLDVTLVDGDRISRINCVRQPFSESEIGLHKATVLATRINLCWGLGWKGEPHFLDEGWREETDIVIGCVDSRKARNMILGSQAYWNSDYWLDLGNNASTGQFVLGSRKT
jgi:PRTRC genetic system ThiF family protein